MWGGDPYNGPVTIKPYRTGSGAGIKLILILALALAGGIVFVYSRMDALEREFWRGWGAAGLCLGPVCLGLVIGIIAAVRKQAEQEAAAANMASRATIEQARQYPPVIVIGGGGQAGQYSQLPAPDPLAMYRAQGQGSGGNGQRWRVIGED